MADRVFPSAKPAAAVNGGGAAGNGAAAPFPPAKSQNYRPVYRPQPMKPSRRRSGRSCCCSCCLWIVFIIVLLVILAAIAAGVFYLLYRPQRPSFTVAGLRLATLNVTSGNQLVSRFDLNVTARNPNKKLVYTYDPVSISIFSSGVDIGDGSFPAFVHEAKNTTLLSAAITSASGQTLDATTASDLKKKSSLPLEIDLETKAGVKVGGAKTKKIGIRVRCDGISVSVPKGKSPATATTSPDVKCKVKLRVKIWKWTF